MSGNIASSSAKSKIVIIKIRSQRLAEIKEKSNELQQPNEQDKPRELKKRRRSTKVTKVETDAPKKIGRPRKSLRAEHRENAEPPETHGSTPNEEGIHDLESRKIDAEILQAHRESQAHLANKHAARWAKMAQEPIDPLDTETVLIKLSHYTTAVAVQVPRIPKYVSPAVQAMVAKSAYIMQKFDAIRQQKQTLAERETNNQILLEGPAPVVNLHRHPSPPIVHLEPASPMLRPLPVQPLPHLYAPTDQQDPQDPVYHLAAATRDHAFRPNLQRDPGVDIDLKAIHLRNLRTLNSQYSPSPQSGEVLEAARSVAYAQGTDTALKLPPPLRPPLQEKFLPIHDQLISEMRIASNRMHYRRRVRDEYRRYTAGVCREMVRADVQTRGRFVPDESNMGAFVTTLPTVDEILATRDRTLKLGYKRQGLQSVRSEQPPQRQVYSEEDGEWKTGEEWRQVVKSKGVSLPQEQRRRLGLDRFADVEMTDAAVNQVMGIDDAWDVNQDVSRLQSNPTRHLIRGPSELFREYVR